MKKQVITALLLTVAATVFAQDADKLIKQKDVKKIIKTLSADNMEGRGTFTPGIEKAARYIEGQYRKIGLQPLPGDNGFRQNFSMNNNIAEKIQVNINGAEITADHVFAIAGASFNWNSPQDVEVVKISNGPNASAELRTVRRSHKKVLALIDPQLEGLFKRISDIASKGISSIKEPDAAQQVVCVLGNFDDIKSLSVNVQIKTNQKPLFNIAGMIPGRTRPDEYVIFSGHYDHLGIIAPVKGDSIANGADDDASGTTAVISLAKYYRKLTNNARTLIFVAFTAEEIGEYGSQYFATQVDPDKVVAMFNIEMIGKPSKWGQNSAFITGFERSDFGTILQKNLNGTSFHFYPDPYPDQNLFYRSDNASLAAVGVPAHTISTDQIDKDPYYHTVKDELSTLDVNNITSTIRAIALSSRSIVSGEDTPKRVPKLER